MRVWGIVERVAFLGGVLLLVAVVWLVMVDLREFNEELLRRYERIEDRLLALDHAVEVVERVESWREREARICQSKIEAARLECAKAGIPLEETDP